MVHTGGIPKLEIPRIAVSLKKAHSEYANKGFELIISPVRRSGFRSASGFEIVFAGL